MSIIRALRTHEKPGNTCSCYALIKNNTHGNWFCLHALGGIERSFSVQWMPTLDFWKFNDWNELCFKIYVPIQGWWFTYFACSYQYNYVVHLMRTHFNASFLLRLWNIKDRYPKCDDHFFFWSGEGMIVSTCVGKTATQGCLKWRAVLF